MKFDGYVLIIYGEKTEYDNERIYAGATRTLQILNDF